MDSYSFPSRSQIQPRTLLCTVYRAIWYPVAPYWHHPRSPHVGLCTVMGILTLGEPPKPAISASKAGTSSGAGCSKVSVPWLACVEDVSLIGREIVLRLRRDFPFALEAVFALVFSSHYTIEHILVPNGIWYTVTTYLESTCLIPVPTSCARRRRVSRWIVGVPLSVTRYTRSATFIATGKLSTTRHKTSWHDWVAIVEAFSSRIRGDDGLMSRIGSGT
jgi:hypothetical protein